MALAGSVVTSDMLSNHIYAGVPAKDITDKVGTQFIERSKDDKVAHLRHLILAFEHANPSFAGLLVPCFELPTVIESEVTYFNVSDRTYTQRHSLAEVAFLKKHTPLIKYTPLGVASRISNVYSGDTGVL